ncbi:hypothetical protein MPER_04944 [Moniliophthora perniciosa FA553]|nr:hypothetical protein MPER_04944 [Moniliophthora perniciosa FA553]
MLHSPAVSALLVGVTSIAMLVLEAVVFTTLFKHWAAFKRIRATPGSIISVTMIVRISIFAFLPMLALGLSVQSVVSKSNPSSNSQANVAVAVLPTAAALIFVG